MRTEPSIQGVSALVSGSGRRSNEGSRGGIAFHQTFGHNGKQYTLLWNPEVERLSESTVWSHGEHFESLYSLWLLGQANSDAVRRRIRVSQPQKYVGKGRVGGHVTPDRDVHCRAPLVSAPPPRSALLGSRVFMLAVRLSQATEEILRLTALAIQCTVPGSFEL
jgi:hypothetical protein